MSEPVTRRVICAANRIETCIILGARHFDKRMHSTMALLRGLGCEWPFGQAEQGFIDQFGVFMTREEALAVAEAAGQLEGRFKHAPLDQLCSEDLY